MKIAIQLLCFLLTASLVSSCIQEEAPNAECDITGVELPGGMLNRQPIISNDKVTLIIKGGTDITELAPVFTLSPGATIEPASGTVRNFSTPQEYTVTSEDREWHKTYIVEAQTAYTVNLEYSFEHVRQVSALGGAASYDVFFELSPDGQESMTWASANPAFALTMQGTTPNTFPTYQADGGKQGKCVALTTRATGTFGSAMKKPLAAGNLFIGEFSMANALAKPLEATHFGSPFMSKPLVLNGSYRYIPGDEYCRLNDNGKLEPVAGEIDKFNIYAVFFEATESMEWLDGTNVMAENNPNIIAVAEIDQPVPSSEWKEFTIPFKYREGKVVDPEKLKDGAYSLTIVMTSSRDGDYFSGAIGSTLYVDELMLHCE